MEGYGFFWIGVIIGLVAWFFLNRASVRANRQVELLESIDRQLSVISGKDSDDIKRNVEKSTSKSANQIMDEAKKKAGL